MYSVLMPVDRKQDKQGLEISFLILKRLSFSVQPGSFKKSQRAFLREIFHSAEQILFFLQKTIKSAL